MVYDCNIACFHCNQCCDMIIQYKLQYASLVAYISLQMVQSTHHDATDSELVLDSPTFH